MKRLLEVRFDLSFPVRLSQADTIAQSRMNWCAGSPSLCRGERHSRPAQDLAVRHRRRGAKGAQRPAGQALARCAHGVSHFCTVSVAFGVIAVSSGAR
jgi:hypothetical protein